MSLEYEPASESLHVSVKWLFFNGGSQPGDEAHMQVQGYLTHEKQRPPRGTLHPTPYTLHPTPHTLQPTPHTLNDSPGTQATNHLRLQG